MQVEEIGGGITNKLFKVTHVPSDESVLVRKFGENTELFIDRRAELLCIQHLNSHGFGAKVLATFENGRIEEFLRARTISPEDMSNENLVPLIAQILARFHSCAEHIVGVPSDSQLWTRINNWCALVNK